MANQMDLNKKTFFVITGASRGIGQTLAIELSKKFKKDSVVLLLARSADGLNATKEQILQANPTISVYTHSISLNHPTMDELKDSFKAALQSRNVNDFELAFIIHNVGTLGNIKKNARQMNDIIEWRDYYDTNVFSVAVLNTLFIDLFKGNRKFIVNISSKAAIVPMEATGFYCSGKAARLMYFRTLALEEPDILVFNYAPGPVDTDMLNDMCANTGSSNMQKQFAEMKDQNMVLTRRQTTHKFIEIIEKGAYKSGDHIDYYD